MSTKALDFDAYIDDRRRDFTGRAWVFNDIDAWLAQDGAPRFFILSGEPGSGKSTLAAQLAHVRKPHARHFCIGGRSDTVDPRVFSQSLSHQLTRLDGFAAALLEEQGVHVDVKIQVQENYGTIIGLQIENLLIKASSPQVAFNQAVLLPLGALYSGGYAGQVLALVDGLDESETFQGGRRIYELLAGLGGLDERVRFFLTVRSGSQAERFLGELPARRLKLDAVGGNNRKDLQDYIRLKTAASAAIQSRLSQSGMDLERFIKLLEGVHQDNFRYLALLFAALERGEQWVDDLERLPSGLDGIYRQHLRDRAIGKNKTLWRAYRPVLGVLAAAREPLRPEMIEKFSGVDGQTVGDILLDAGEFLDRQPEEEPRYSLYHRSLADFLGDRLKAGEEFWIDLQAVHRKIAAAYQPALAAKAWRKIDDYGLNHLAQHVLDGGRGGDFSFVLEPGWMKLRIAKENYGYSGFMADIGLAWRAAELDDAARMDGGEAMANWTLQARYALIEAGIRTLARDVPPALLVRLVQEGIWQAERAIGLAAQAPDLNMRIEGLCALLHSGSLEAHQAGEVQKLLQEWGADPVCGQERAEPALIPGLPFSQDALNLEQKRQVQRVLKRVLKRKADHVEWLPTFGSKEKSLMSIMSELLTPASEASINRRGYLADLLGIRPSVNGQVVRRNEWEKSLSLALELGFTSGQAETLFQLALEKVKSIQSLDAYEMGLWALARYLPAALEQRFLDLALALPPDAWRARILERLAPGLSREALTRTAEACTTLQEDHLAKMRFYVGIALQTRSSELRRGAVEQVFEHAGQLASEDQAASITILAGLAELLTPGQIELVLEQAQRGLTRQNLYALGRLLPHLEPERRASLAATAIRRPYDLEMEGYLAPTFIQVWPYLSIDDRADYLRRLPSKNPARRDEILAAMQATDTAAREAALVLAMVETIFFLQDDLPQNLKTLLPHMQPPHLEKALELASAVEPAEIRRVAVLLLASRLPVDQRTALLHDVLEEALSLPVDQATGLAATLAGVQPDELVNRAAWGEKVLTESLHSAAANGLGGVASCLGDLAPAWAVLAGSETVDEVYAALHEEIEQREWV